MERSDILAEIRRCAAANGGVSIGRARFEAETGITESDWHGKYWARWTDAVREAGLEPGAWQQPLDEHEALTALVALIRDLDRFPTVAERKLRRRSHPAFPSHNVFSRFGSRSELAARLVQHCSEQGDLDDVRVICAAVVADARPRQDESDRAAVQTGTVYLMKSGAHYKVGRSNSSGRRAYELAIQLPERLEVSSCSSCQGPSQP